MTVGDTGSLARDQCPVDVPVFPSGLQRSIIEPTVDRSCSPDCCEDAALLHHRRDDD